MFKIWNNTAQSKTSDQLCRYEAFEICILLQCICSQMLFFLRIASCGSHGFPHINWIHIILIKCDAGLKTKTSVLNAWLGFLVIATLISSIKSSLCHLKSAVVMLLSAETYCGLPHDFSCLLLSRKWMKLIVCIQHDLQATRKIFSYMILLPVM